MSVDVSVESVHRVDCSPPDLLQTSLFKERQILNIDVPIDLPVHA